MWYIIKIVPINDMNADGREYERWSIIKPAFGEDNYNPGWCIVSIRRAPEQHAPPNQPFTMGC